MAVRSGQEVLLEGYVSGRDHERTAGPPIRGMVVVTIHFGAESPLICGIVGRQLSLQARVTGRGSGIRPDDPPRLQA